jgi:KEOPS complex subunit Pcc1
MKGSADFTFEVDRPEQIFQALSPELEDELSRSRVSLIQGPDWIRMTIEGEDIVSIRAALNTWMRLIKIAIEMASI